MRGLEDPYPAGDWESFRAARDRFFARVRPEAMDDPPPSLCPDALPADLREGIDDEARTPDEDPAGT